MKWKLPSFKGENDPNIFLDWERQVENMFMLKNCNEFLKAVLVIAEISCYALHWWERAVNQRVRSGRPPVDTWRELKALMRERFVPEHYYRDLHYKLMTLKQGAKSVEEYRQELELYILRLNLEEDKDASMVRFLSSLQREIANQLELYPHTTYEDMCNLANKIESQRKRNGMMRSLFPKKRQVASTKPPTSNFKPWPKKKESPRGTFQPPTKPKMEERGHYASSCPTKRTFIFREDLNGWIEKEEDESNECVEGEENGEDDELVDLNPLGSDDDVLSLVTIRALSAKTFDDNMIEQRENIFHSKCKVVGSIANLIIDSGSCPNFPAMLYIGGKG
ncbi:hypothetical protein M9H77_30449 [Catharanthus roseus]|uniref:Uncharacterized protein n=1 Tax=Catharanthus roseus TaxID=4058 RepID=A0ACB9ZXA7_CATRO|nr:hypothetical protein M9H77_30449 [Catharanthus roseus]